MECVGRRVRKTLGGDCTVFGLVRAYEQTTGFCKIVYDGGDSEEVHLSEVYSLLMPVEAPPTQPLRLPDGEPIKRRRVGNEGKGDGNSMIEGGVCVNSVGKNDGSGQFDLSLDKGFDLNEAPVYCLSDDDHDGNAFGGGAERRGFDLNEAVDLEMDEGLSLNKGVGELSLGVKKEMFDLNLGANESFGNSSWGREMHLFDLNLQYTEGEERNLGGCDGQFGVNEKVCGEGDLQATVAVVEDDSARSLRRQDRNEGNVAVEKKGEIDIENISPQSVQRKNRRRKIKDASNNDIELLTPESPKVEIEADRMELYLESRQGASLQKASDCDIGEPEAIARGRKDRRRKEVLKNDNGLPTPVTGLKRSNCRARRAAGSSADQVCDVPKLDGINNQFSSPSISEVSDEKTKMSVSCAVLPPMVELPPSYSLDLEGVSVSSFLSVYAFLRSFSTFLFLSPFEFEDFVIAVKSNDSTLLFDSIHVSLLRTLRKQLESLSDEGSMSASNCLRSISWDFLDLITWPMFVVEYLLLHRPGYIPGLTVSQLKHIQMDYYKQPVSTKVGILRLFCDDITEMEAFRNEISRRMWPAERPTAWKQNTDIGRSRKRKPMVDVTGTSCVTKEYAEEHVDGNSDECCLCKMDGNLICCDGCPAAFHPRCVGITSSLLPDGDWYCPECTMEKDKPWSSVRNAIRGSELLGIDPHGRAYYNSCGYLLVIYSCSDEYLSWFYNGNNLATVIEALESLPYIYDAIINAICKQWNVVRGVGGSRNDLDDRSYSMQSTFPESRQLVDNETFAEKRSHEKFMVPANSCYTEPENAGQGSVLMETETHEVRLENYLASSEGSAEVSQTPMKTDTSNENGLSCSEKCPQIPNVHSPVKIENNHIMTLTSANAEKGDNISLKTLRFPPDTINSGGLLSQVPYGANYVNCYEFAKTASSYFEKLTCNSSDKTSEDAAKSVEDIIAGQLKVVTNRFAEFSWANVQTSNADSKKERCGWCFYCRAPEDEKDCLFIMNDSVPAVDNHTCDALEIRSRNNSKNHLIDVKCHIVCIENHLHGLLLGPWLNPQYSISWRESVLGANDVTSLKNLLVKLELNMHHLALSSEWRKHVDSTVTMGSAYHFVSSSARGSSKHGIVRKKANPFKVATASTSKAAFGMRLFWWRGGRVSRTLFNWKVLPNSLASKAARQGGRKKIPGILYPESGEYAKRIKYVSWRAAVETSRNVEQLALQVRELDANIRWDDIGNNSLLSKMGKDGKRSARSFKKVMIRRKCSEGTVVKYLLDFGKRRFIPDVAVIHGSLLEDSSNERKKYWLEESHVPLHLLKAFEEKRIARKYDKGNPGKLGESSGIITKPLKNKGFSYLFSRAERSENCPCGHCNKDVLISEAISCQHCQGFFHKKHVWKSTESVSAADCTYTCHKCMGGDFMEIDAGKRNSKVKKASKAFRLLHTGKRRKMRKGKQPLDSRNTNPVSFAVPLRRSVRCAERIAKLSLQNAKVRKRNRCKNVKSEKDMNMIKKSKNSIQKPNRTPVNNSFWLNGIRLSRKPNDERSMHFRSRKLLVLSGEMNFVHDKPKCSLCKELEYKSELNYVACEICEVWFHGDALSLPADKIENIIGFMCHMCLNKEPPVCPHRFSIGSNKDELVSENDQESAHTVENAKCLAHIDESSAYLRCDLNHEQSTISSIDGIEKLLPGSIHESDQNNKDCTSSEKLNAAENESTTHNSNMVKEA